MIAYQDFMPKKKTGGSLFKEAEYESFDAAVEAANKWIKQDSIKVVTIETVLLPNISSEEGQEGTQDAHLPMMGWVNWYQFVRVWYER